MRTLWVLILFGSLIIHHCFTTTSGEVVPASPSKEPHPSFSDCKPYVDAALKGDIPAEPEGDSSQSDEDETPDQGSKDDEDDDEDDGGVSHPGGGGKDQDDDSSEEDHEEPEINGLEVEDETPTTKTTTKDSSEEEEIPEPPPPPPVPVSSKSGPQGSAGSPPKTKAEESKKRDESDESDEKGSGKTTPSNPARASPQRDGTSHHSMAKDANESSDESNTKTKSQSSDKKVSNHPKETKSEVKKVVPPPPAVEENDADDDESSEEEVVVKKDVKVTKSEPVKKDKKVEKVDDDDDDDDDDSPEEVTPPIKSKKAKKIEPVDESEEEEVKPPKKVKKVKVVPIPKNDDDDDDESSEEEKSYQPRSRANLIRILGLDETPDLKSKNNLLDKVTQQTLKELKSIYEYAIKPLETLYKYRDLSNRHFGDPEIFSKPMIVFMGPWSGGKSTIINWLLGIQDDEHALRTGADPSPAQFNILTHGNEEEVLDGTQLAADWTFSGLQKFGQSFLDRLRGRKLPNRLLEKVNLVEIPGILEIRKQVERSFPFNDACQWFIDRADVLFLVYDPAKLDIGPETEAILDQLKGRESQVRIVLNKADTVRPDELLRVQATLIWNISPLMASAEPPVLYVASLWDHPLQPDAPASLLNAHENLFLKDISDATHKRVETRIAAARRFAVRVRNHAKMCDCYLNTYNNHRSFFSNKKRISDDIIDHPQNYHIYEGLSTLTNISRYDLPDPDSYRDFFRLNPVWEFPSLASTCTYFRGCPINKLDIAIAYDLPELLGRYRRQRESIVTAPTGTLPDIKLKEVGEKKDAPIDIPKGKSRWYKLPPEEQQQQQKQVDESSKVKKDAKGKAPRQEEVKPTPSPSKDQPKPKNKWWKEVPEVVVKPAPPESPKTKEDGSKKSKKSEEPKKPEPPREGYKLIPPKNKWWTPYYEPIAPKESQQQPKKNKWYKN